MMQIFHRLDPVPHDHQVDVHLDPVHGFNRQCDAIVIVFVHQDLNRVDRRSSINDGYR